MSKKNSKKRRLNYNKVALLCLVVVLIFGGVFAFKNNNKTNNEDPNENKNIVSTFNEQNEKVETYTASILAAGDIMVHTPQLKAQYNASTKTYNFDNNFKYVKKYIEKADYSLANLETTLAGNDVYKYSSYPMFNSPDELADALKNAGFDLLSTINNHSYDKGGLGVSRTLEVLKKKGFDTVGTREKESDNDYLIKDINNIKVGFTSYSYGEDYPLGLTAQYSGGGLWGPDYKITHPLRMKYAIIPHRGKWDKASIADDSDCWNEPLLHSCYPVAKPESKSFIDLQNTGYQVSALQMKDGKVLLRLFNSEGDEKLQKVTIDMPLSGVEEVDLNGQCIERKKIKTRAGKSEMTISMPRFGIKTFVLSLT